MLETESVRIIRDQDVVSNVISEIQPGHLAGGEVSAVSPVRQLEVIDVRHITHVAVVIGGIVVVVVDRDEGGAVLYVDQVILIRAVVDGDVILAIVLVIVKIVVRCGNRGKVVVIEVVCVVVVIPGLKIILIGIAVVVRCVGIQKIRQLDIGLIVVGRIRCVMYGIEGFIVAVYDLRGGRVSTTVIIGHIPVSVLYRFGRRGIIFLFFVCGKYSIRPASGCPASIRFITIAQNPIPHGLESVDCPVDQIRISNKRGGNKLNSDDKTPYP